MDILWGTLAFAAKATVVFLTVSACAIVIVGLIRQRVEHAGELHVRRLNERLERLADALRRELLGSRELKKLRRRTQKEGKKAKKQERKNVFVLDFKGDIAATAVFNLRREISAVLAVAKAGDEVVVRLESPGGIVHGYGLAASQLARLKQKGLRLTVCVDKVAASGGYMMACVADEIIAAPFAIVGSIGVVAGIPNLHRLLQTHGIDYEEMTAGEYKRTVSVLGEITEKGRQKLQEQIDEAHQLFKGFVHENRPKLDVDRVSTGEYWYGSRSVELGLVDRLLTSDDHLISRIEEAHVLEVSYRGHKNLRERVASSVADAADRMLLTWWTRLETNRLT